MILITFPMRFNLCGKWFKFFIDFYWFPTTKPGIVLKMIVVLRMIVSLICLPTSVS